MKNSCPFKDELIEIIQMKTAPICFHCGNPYIRDLIHCGAYHNTWMPNCKCLSKTTIRIVTGNGFRIE